MDQPRHGVDTGVRDVDAEHQLQLSLVDALEQLVRRGEPPAALARTVGQLAELTRAHFGSEELLMRLYEYPRRGGHEQEHGRHAQLLGELREELSAAPASALAAIAAWRASLLEHIRTTDRDFARWCLESAMRDVKAL